MKKLGLLALLAIVAAAGITFVSSTRTEATTTTVSMADPGSELELMAKGFVTTGGQCYTCIQQAGSAPCTGRGEKCDGTAEPCWCHWCVDHFICNHDSP